MNKTVETSVKLEEIHEIPPFPYRTTYVSISANLSRNYLLEPVKDISSYRGPSLLDSAIVLASVSTQLAT